MRLSAGCALFAGLLQSFADFARKRIAIPGERTTAFMLLQLALGRRPKTVPMRFDRIVDAVAKGEVDAGLIIRDESRFTYRDAGLISIVDMGEWGDWDDDLAGSAGRDFGAQRHRRRRCQSLLNSAINEVGPSREKMRTAGHAVRARTRCRDELCGDEVPHRALRKTSSPTISAANGRSAAHALFRARALRPNSDRHAELVFAT